MELDGLDDLVDLETRFYEEGYRQGYEHGQSHGFEEGRELGVSKAYEIWEELGYYEGFALFWRALMEQQNKADARATGLLQQLTDLINAFPMINDSSLLQLPEEEAKEHGTDMEGMLGAIRSKYRTACAALGVRPRPKVATATESSHTHEKDVKLLANEI